MSSIAASALAAAELNLPLLKTADVNGRDARDEIGSSTPDVIVTGGNPVIAAVRRTATTIPVVMGISRDPVGAGFVASYGRPGGNVTGLAADASDDQIRDLLGWRLGNWYLNHRKSFVGTPALP